MTVYYASGFGAESYNAYGTCDNDTYYNGKNKDTAQDGICIYTAHENIPDTRTYTNCLDDTWDSFSFNDTDSVSRFRNCEQAPGIDPCGSYHDASTY